MWIVFIFWIAMYALFVKIIVWAYEKFFEKKTINANIKWEDFISFKTNIFPIVIENKHQKRLLIAGRFSLLCFFLYLWYLLSIPLATPDSSKALSGYLGIKTAQVGILLTIFVGYKTLWGLIKNRLFITIDKNKIIYEDINEKGTKIVHIIMLDDIIKVEWSYFPNYFIEHKYIIINKESSDGKFKYVFGIPLRFIVSIVHFLFFSIVSFFRIRKYYIVQTKDNIFSLPFLPQLAHKQNIHFSKSTFLN